MPRRRRKEHEPDHVRAGLQRDVERLARGQAANFDDQGHVSRHGFGQRRSRKSDAIGAGSTTSRPACLARWPHTSRSACGAREGAADRTARGAAPARRSASCARACRASASCCRAARRQWRCRNQVAEPPATTPSDRHRDDDDEQRQRDRDRRIGRIERIERHRHQMPIGDREDDEDQAQRNQRPAAVKNLRMTISRVDGDRRAHPANGCRLTTDTRETLTRRPRALRRRGSAVRAFPCPS